MKNHRFKFCLIFFVCWMLSMYTNAQEFSDNGFKFSVTSLTNKTVKVIGVPDATSVTIPDSVSYNYSKFSVTEIGESCCYGNETIHFIHIPEGVTTLGRFCFAYASIKSITLPNSLKTMEEGCFKRSAFIVIPIPDGVTEIGNECFAECSSLREITIPNSVKTLGDRCFSGVKITDISVPNSITKMGENCFSYCSALKSVTIEDGITVLSAGCFANCGTLTSITLPESLKTINRNCFDYCSSLTHINLPSELMTIGEYCFDGCKSLASITIPSSVSALPYCCFRDCSSLSSISIPQSVISIGGWCFYGCLKLKSISLPRQITSLKDYCFSHCSRLTSIRIPDGVTYLGIECFNDCSSLTSISIPSSVTSLGRSCFFYCSGLTSITIPDGVTNIGDQCFAGCSALTSISVPSSVKSLGSSCFSSCSGLTSISLPEQLTTLGSNCFSGCESLSQINLPSSLTTIGSMCFEGCAALTSLIIPDGVKAIEDRSFENCKNLKILQLGNKVTSIGIANFSGLDSLQYVYCRTDRPPTLGTSNPNIRSANLYVPKAGVSLYQTTAFWRNFNQIIGVAQPSISCDGQNIEINIEDNSSIFYSINGTEFRPYEKPIKVYGLNEVIRAYSRKDDLFDSEITKFTVNSFGSDYYAEIGLGGSLEDAYRWADEATRERILSNPNLLAYATYGVTAADLKGKVTNIIIGNKADVVKISDGFPWYCPREFEAGRVSFTREFSKQTAIDGGCAGWETIALPFDVQTITHNKGQLYPFAANADADAHRFWLYAPESYDWQAAGTMEANVPYLIAMPNNAVYYEPFNITGAVTFSATNVTVPATPDVLSYNFRDGSLLTANYLNLAADSQRLVVNDEAVDGNEPGSCFVADTRAVRPFEAYLTAPGQSRVPIFNTTSVSDGLMAEMALRVWCDTPQSVSIFAPCDASLQIYDISGRAVRTVKVDAGETVRISDLTAGLYIIAKTKIAIIR